MSLPVSDEESNSKLSPPKSDESSVEEELKFASTHLEVIALDSPSSGNASSQDVIQGESVNSSPKHESQTKSYQEPAEQSNLSETEFESNTSPIHTVSEALTPNIGNESKNDSKAESESVLEVKEEMFPEKDCKETNVSSSEPIAEDSSSENKSPETPNNKEVTEPKPELRTDTKSSAVDLKDEVSPEIVISSALKSKPSISIVEVSEDIQKETEVLSEKVVNPNESSVESDPFPVFEEEDKKSGPAGMPAEKRKNILKSQKDKQRPLKEVVQEFFEQDSESSPKQIVRRRRRSNTLDDISEISFDAQTSVKSLSIDSESIANPTSDSPTKDRNKRSASVPVIMTEGIPKVRVDRRASSEVPSPKIETVRESDFPVEGMDIGSPTSYSSQAISLDEEVTGDSSNVVENPIEDISRQTSQESESQPQSSVESSSEESKDCKNENETNGGLPSLVESSTRTSEVELRVQNLKGWMAQGNFEGRKYLTENPVVPSSDQEKAGPSCTKETALMPPPHSTKSECLSDAVGKESSETSSLSEATSSSSATSRSAVRKLSGWLSKGAFTDDRHLTKDDESSDISSEVAENVQTIPTKAPEALDCEEKVEIVSEKLSTNVSEESKVEPMDESETHTKSEDGSSLKRQPVTPSKDPLSDEQGTSEEPSERRTRSKRKRLDTQKGLNEANSSAICGKQVVSPGNQGEGMASKKYRSEFSRPVEAIRRSKRSHSTGSVKDESMYSGDIRNLKPSLRQRTQKKDDSKDSKDSKKKDAEE